MACSNERRIIRDLAKKWMDIARLSEDFIHTQTSLRRILPVKYPMFFRSEFNIEENEQYMVYSEYLLKC